MRNSIKAIIIRLQEIEKDVEGYLKNCEDTEDEERSEKLEIELEAIQNALDALEDIE